MSARAPWILPLASVLVAVLGTGCASSGRLVAADGSHRLLARDAQSGMTVVLTTESWTGDSAYSEDLTIFHLLIANMGSEPVLIAPGDFELRDDRGFHVVLLDAGGTFQAIPPGSEPAGYADRPLAYDPGRARNFETVHTEDGELGRLALPWGVLLPGTQMRGYVYFEDVRSSANAATLIWHAQTPDHRPLADFGFELHVARH